MGGRKSSGARAKRQLGEGRVQYAWREYKGGPERTQRGPGGEANLHAYQAHVLRSWEEKETPNEPKTFFGEAESKRAADSNSMTLRAWIGDGVSGPFREWSKQGMKDSRALTYERTLRGYGTFEIIGDVPMRLVGRDLMHQVQVRAHRCVACHQRALDAGASVSSKDLRASAVPWDGDCDAHYPMRAKKRTTMKVLKKNLSAAFETAIQAGELSETFQSPVRFFSIEKWAEPQSNDDLRTALRLDQLEEIVAAHPEPLRIIPILSAYGMLRRSEMWGLQRGDFCSLTDGNGKVAFKLKRSRDSAGRYSSDGKTVESLGSDIVLPEVATNALRLHLDRYVGAEAGAPLVSMRRGDVTYCLPESYAKFVMPKVQKALSFDLPFKLDHRGYRSTGATALLHMGVQESTVVKMGRWSNAEVLRKHYNRLYGEQLVAAASAFDDGRADALGIARPGAPVVARSPFVVRQMEAQTTRIEMLESLLNEAGIELPADTITPIKMGRPSTWVDEPERVRAAIEVGRSQKSILETLGLSAATRNYKNLRKFAAEHKLDLPDPWNQKAG